MSKSLRIALSLVACTVIAGCGGTINDPNVTIASLSLTLDHDSGGVRSDACVRELGATACTPYPNDSECATMRVDVLADGRTIVACYDAKNALVEQGEATLADGSPFVCKATADLSCQICHDVYGNPVLDTCNRGTKLYRRTGGGWGTSPSDGIPGAAVTPPGGSTGGGTPPDTLPPGTGGACDPSTATLNYQKELNKILQSEGLGFEWDASWLEQVDPTKGFWGFKGYGNQDLCAKKFKKKLCRCWNPTKDKCHCFGKAGGKQTCRCVRINVFALKAACAKIDKSCDNYKDHVAKLVMSYGAATAWLFGTSAQGGGNGDNPGQLPPGIIPPKCKGSPLVLDLAGNGISPTSEAAGVEFDLLGLGAQKTAWIAGDDALLVYDRNGNGQIDDGSELFGEATPVGGLPAADGFEALAELDKPANGGNGNGIVEKGDLLFKELRVWRDKNKDGVSQAVELATLNQVGVIGINTEMESQTRAPDAHGNDLGMRGSFIFADGKTGLMIDVLFSTSR